MVTGPPLPPLTWAVPSYDTVTSRASWCGLQAMPVILDV